MSDPTRLLVEDDGVIGEAAGAAARQPDFETVLRRGRRRRNRRNGIALGLVAATVAGVIGVSQFVGSGTGTEPPPAAPTTPTAPATDSGGRADRIIDHADARIETAAISPTDPDARAVVWRLPGSGNYALGVTGDGFATRAAWSFLGVPKVTWLEEGRFLVVDEALSKAWIVDGAGRQPITVAGPESPVAPGEVPLGMSSGVVAIDPSTGRAHPVPTPDEVYDVVAFDGRLSATSNVIEGDGATTTTIHWSDDGGATWRTASYGVGPMITERLVPTGAGAALMVLEIADNTVGSVAGVWTVPASGGDPTRTGSDRDLMASAGAFVYDNELRMFADDGGDGTGPAVESSLYAWADGAWERITTDQPEVTDVGDRTLVQALATQGRLELGVAVGDQLYRSTDGGVSWESIPAR